MGALSVPVRLTLAESGAAALAEAARDLDDADDARKFLAALENNHKLWLILSDLAERYAWDFPDRRLAEYVTTTSRKAGFGVQDEEVATLVQINRNVSSKMAQGRDIELIARRARLAWQENGRPGCQSLEDWLIAEIERKSKLSSSLPTVAVLAAVTKGVGAPARQGAYAT